MTYDIIIIGSGLGGLVCGSILSQLGQHVLVLERDSHIGGCLQCYSQHGQRHDTGFHYVGGLDEGGSLYQVFNPLGLMSLPWKQLDADGFDRISLGGHHYQFRQGYEVCMDAFADEFPKDREALRQFGQLLKDTEYQQMECFNPLKPYNLFAATSFGSSAYDYLHEHFQSEELINLLSSASMKIELRSESLPLFTFAHVMSSYIRSSWRLQGGGSQIADLLSRNIKSYGGEVLTNSEVIELQDDGSRITAALCKNGNLYEGRMFISDTHPAVTCNFVKGNALRKVYRHRITSQPNTHGMFTVSLTLKHPGLPYQNYNQYLYTNGKVWDYQGDWQHTDRIMLSSQPPTSGDRTLQIDLLTPMSWQSCLPWADTRLGHRGDEYMKLKQQKADACVALAEQMIPGLNEMTESRTISTPLTWRDFTATPEGSAFGMRKDWHQPLLTVLSARTPLPNLLLTGQSLMIHGIQGVTMTALATCGEIVGREAIWDWLNGKTKHNNI